MCLPPTPSFVQPSPSSRGGPVASLFWLPCCAEWLRLRDADGRPRGIVHACAPCIIRSIQRSGKPNPTLSGSTRFDPNAQFRHATLLARKNLAASMIFHPPPSFVPSPRNHRPGECMCVSACGKHRESRGRHPSPDSTRAVPSRLALHGRSPRDGPCRHSVFHGSRLHGTAPHRSMDRFHAGLATLRSSPLQTVTATRTGPTATTPPVRPPLCRL